MTKVELTRFRIKKGKEAKAQEWMDFLNEHHADTVATMAGEKMYVERASLKRKIQMDIPIFTGIQFKEKTEMPLKNQKAILIRNILSIGMNVSIRNISQLI